MNGWSAFFFGVYPYICLTVFVCGLVFRYMADPGQWNARSSEIFERKQLRIGSMLFHYGILFSLGGHVVGLLVPAVVLTFFGVSEQLHTEVAGFAGRIIVPLVLAGLGLLLWRRHKNPLVKATTSHMDLVVLWLILLNALTGGYQAYTETFPALTTIGPWIRSVLIWQPQPSIMAGVPFFLQFHVFCGLTIFAIAPFSRLVHLFSAPWSYVAHPHLLYRRPHGNL